MSMERWNPFREMETFRQAMERLFDDRLGSGYLTGTNQPLDVAMDVHQTSNGYEVSASLPGVKPEDVDITINGDILSIRGKTEQSSETQEGNYLFRERRNGSFQRTIRLPEPINSDQVDASLSNGVLRLTLPRLQQNPSRRIQVQSGNMGSQIEQGATQSLKTSTGNSGGLNAQEAMTASASPNTMSTERPTVLNNLSSTQMNSIESHVMARDEAGFKATAKSYGWDDKTTDQVWRFMQHRAGQNEAKAAFEKPSSTQS